MSATATGPNVVVITVDCLRRDRLSAYGYPRSTTPFLDRLLERGLHGTSAHSTSSWTCPAVCSLLTGLYPHRHGGGLVPGEPKNLSRANLPTVLPAEIPTLADRLSGRGYATAAIGAVWNAHLPLAGRFDEMAMLEAPARRPVARSLEWISGLDRPFLLWLHLGDAHEPLDVPRDLREAFGPIPRVRRARRWAFTRSTDDVGSEAFRRYRDARTRLYDAAVRSVDRELEAFLGSLGRDTVVVVTSDHGEEFWEHREDELAFLDPRGVVGTGHGHHLFQVHLLVPLILVGPGVPSAAIATNVSLVDVVPTILSLLGEDAGGLDGRSLLEPVAWDRPILAGSIAYGYDKQVVIEGDRKLLSAPLDGIERLFALGADRLERGTIDDPALAERLRSMLPGGPIQAGEQVIATEEIEEHLRELGYLE
jgi:arylsulfatase A-like enzyme